MPAFCRFSRLILPCFAVLLLPGCRSEPPQLPGFDAAAFRADRHACAGTRQRLAPALLSHRHQLVGMREPELTALLGRPDQADIGGRGLRTYVYLLGAGPACGVKTSPPALRISLDALDRVREVATDDAF